MKKRMNIACASNERYLKYTYVMLTSLLENNKNYSVHVYFLFYDIPVEKLMIFEQLEKDYDVVVECCQVSDDMIPRDLPHTNEWSIETYYRLALGEILPETEDRILYLDVDVIVNKDLSDFYDRDMGEYCLLACEDMTTFDGLLDSQNKLFAEVVGGSEFCYFNAGVILFNMKNIRKKGYDLAYYLRLIGQLSLTALDQDLLNYVYYGKVLFEDCNKYDLFSRMAHNQGRSYEDVKENAAIIHFAGRKPWEHEAVRYDIELLWWDYARKTSFYYDMMEKLMINEMKSNYLDGVMSKLSSEKRELLTTLQKIANSL